MKYKIAFTLEIQIFLFVFGFTPLIVHANIYEGIGQVYLTLFVISPLLLLEGIIAIILSLFRTFSSLRLVKIFNRLTLIIFTIGLVVILTNNGRGFFLLIGVMFVCSLPAILIPNIQYKILKAKKKA